MRMRKPDWLEDMLAGCALVALLACSYSLLLMLEPAPAAAPALLIAENAAHE